MYVHPWSKFDVKLRPFRVACFAHDFIKRSNRNKRRKRNCPSSSPFLLDIRKLMLSKDEKTSMILEPVAENGALVASNICLWLYL